MLDYFDDLALRQIIADLAALCGVRGPWNMGFTLRTFGENVAVPQRTLHDADFARIAVLRALIDLTGVFAHDLSPVPADSEPALHRSQSLLVDAVATVNDDDLSGHICCTRGRQPGDR